MPKKKKKVFYCRTCEYIRSHHGCGLNADLMSGISFRVLTQKTGLGYKTLKRHRDEGHMMERFLPRIGCTKAAKEGLDLLKCAREIYDDCKENAGLAKGVAKTPRDYRDASGCWDAATKALGILKPEEKPSSANQTTNINFSKLSDEKLNQLESIINEANGPDEKS